MTHETAYWLALVNAGGLKLTALKPIVQQWYLMEGKPIAQLFNLSAAELAMGFNLSEEEASGLLAAADTYPQQVRTIEKWRAQGIEVLPLSHPDYPSRLLYTLPPGQQPLLLWAQGQSQLLAEPALTILGNPDPRPEIVQFVQELAAILVEENIGVISGYGKGLDRIAFETILATGNGHAFAVLPMGLAAFAQLTAKLNPFVAAGRTVLLSPFPPDTPFKDSLAEARNLLVDSLAMALLVPELDQTSQPRAQTALERGMPVLVGMTDSPENRALIAAGAFLMTDPGEVVEMVQQAIIDNALQSQQAQTPASDSPPSPPPVLHPLDEADDDYSLGAEMTDPLAAGEALNILSSMGTVPNSLRARLMAMEEESRRNKTGGEQQE